MNMRQLGFLATTACATMLSGCSENGLGAKYTATSLLRVSWAAPFIATPPAHRDTEKEFEIYKNTQRQLIVSRFVLLAALRNPNVAKLPSVQAEQPNGDLVRWLGSIVKVEFPDDAEIMSVSVSRGDPQEAAALARAVVDAYLTEVVNAERDQKRQRLSELDRAYIEKETDIRNRREDLKKLAEQLGVSDTGTLTLKQRLALEELYAYRQELKELQAGLRSLKRDLAAKKAVLEETKGDERAAILKEIKRLEASIAAATEQQSAIRKDVDLCRKEAEQFGVSTVDIEMMRADIKTLEAVLTEIATEREKLRVEIRAAPRVTLLERADVPESKD